MTRAIGIHVSIAERIDLAVDRARELGCVNTFQIFTCSPRRWAAKPLDVSQSELFREKSSASNLLPIAHMPYMPNLASSDRDFFSGSIEVLMREIKRCEDLGIQNLVVHFGSTMGAPIEEGHKRIVYACRKAIHMTESLKVRILLENSAGTRNSAGSKFEYIRNVLDQIGDPERTGVCLDSCHAFASGYDFRTKESAEKIIEEFDEIVGVERLFLVHVNDSRGGLGSSTDRHEHIGLGQIGDTGFRALFSVKKIASIPLILETPIDQRRDDKANLVHTKKLLN